MIPDEELKTDLASRRPYQKWVEEQRIELTDLPQVAGKALNHVTLTPRMQAFGYTQETMQFMLLPMIKELRDPLGSMGNDAALAVMSDKPRMLYDYFKQRFAQVTNPPIDSIREEVIMALDCYIGPEQNLLQTEAKNAHRLRVPHPILTNEELASITAMDHRGWRTATIDITYPANSGQHGLTEALQRINQEASQAIADGYSLVVLSDRALGTDRVAMSALLAVGSVHHSLVGKAERSQIGLIVETGEAREVHHHCLLVGYGADAINPYLAFEALWDAQEKGAFDSVSGVETSDDVVRNYRKAVAKGMLKVMAKMGISTLQSYKGAQIFEAVGLAQDVINQSFIGTASRVEGVSMDVLAEEMQRRHAIGYPQRDQASVSVLPNPGDFHWRRHGDTHMWDPKSVASLQAAARSNSEDAYWAFANQVNDDNTRKATLRGLLDFNFPETGISLDEV